MPRPNLKTARYVYTNLNCEFNQVYYNGERVKTIYMTGDKRFLGILLDDNTSDVVNYKTKLEVR